MSVKLDISTNFINKEELITHIKRSEFYIEFVNILKENPNSKDHRFDPLLEDGKNIANPQNLYYNEIPRFSFPFIEFLLLDIHQKWTMNQESFSAIVSVKLKGNELCKINLEFKLKKKKSKNIEINLEGKWLEKQFFVPDFVLENITNEVKKIIERLLNNK